MESLHETLSALVASLGPQEGLTLPQEGRSRGFGSRAFRVGGKIFATVEGRGRLLLKLPAERVRLLLASGQGVPFESGRARWTREWVCLLPGTEASWSEWVREALEFVRSQLPPHTSHPR